MPASTPKAQPWKANWPPAKQRSDTAGPTYQTGDTGALLVDGQHNCTSADLFADLVCSRTDTDPAKAQPWKANWPPAKQGSDTAGHIYQTDDTGALLVDGAHQCTSADLFAELA